MKKVAVILTLATLILAVTVVWLNIGDNESLQKQYSAQTDDQASLTVEVTPENLAPGEKASFKVSLNTHSVELDSDLTKISQLTDNLGNNYLPVSWSGGSGGHHLSGELVFPALSPSAKSVSLTIQTLGGVDRNFKWDL